MNRRLFNKTILENSEEKDNVMDAMAEWEFSGIEQDEDYCICGHKLKNVITIENRYTNKSLIVGTSCIRKFDNNTVGHILNAIKREIKRLKMLAYVNRYLGVNN